MVTQVGRRSGSSPEKASREARARSPVVTTRSTPSRKREASWLARLRVDPTVRITREGVRSAFRAEIAEGSADRVNLLMREKYGRSDELMMALRDPSDVTAIRLVPLTQAQGWSEQYP